MDPVSQTQASEDLAHRGLAVVGWYHSHPTFAPIPSVRDIETQTKFQVCKRVRFSVNGESYSLVIILKANNLNRNLYSIFSGHSVYKRNAVVVRCISDSLSPTVLFRTTLTRTITLDKLLMLLGSNHLLGNYSSSNILKFYGME